MKRVGGILGFALFAWVCWFTATHLPQSEIGRVQLIADAAVQDHGDFKCILSYKVKEQRFKFVYRGDGHVAEVIIDHDKVDYIYAH